MMESSDIDPRFYSSETGRPFEHCLVCSKDLEGSGEDYFVERIFRRVEDLEVVEPIFEYGMCASCGEQLRQELSESSRQNIEQLFEERLRQNGLPPEEDRLTTCLLTGKSIEASSEFSYHAHCRGNQMITSIFPYSISDEAMDEITELLSAETTDQLDDFKGKYFTGPPEFADLLNPKRLLPL